MGDMFAVGGCDCLCQGVQVLCSSCTPLDMPGTLYVSDTSNTSIPATWNSSYSSWFTPYLSTSVPSQCAACTGGISASPCGSGDACYFYRIRCSSANYIYVLRCYCVTIVTGCSGYQYVPYSCAPSGVLGCTYYYSYYYSGSKYSPINCASILWSGSMNMDTGTIIHDPMSGTVTVSQ